MELRRRNVALAAGLLAVLAYGLVMVLIVAVEEALRDAIASSPWWLVDLGWYSFQRPTLAALLAGLMQSFGIGFVIGWVLATAFRRAPLLERRIERAKLSIRQFERKMARKMARIVLFLALAVIGSAAGSAAANAQDAEILARAGETLVITLSGVTLSDGTLPEGASFDGVTGHFEWTPAPEQVGEHRIAFASPIASLTIRVEPALEAAPPISFGGCDCTRIPDPGLRDDGPATAGLFLGVLWLHRRRTARNRDQGDQP